MFKIEVTQNGVVTNANQGTEKSASSGIRKMFNGSKRAILTDLQTSLLKKKKLKKLEARRQKRLFGELLIDKISTINDSKGVTGESVDLFMTHPTLSLLREHLWAGNIPTFVEKLRGTDVSAFFSNAEKAFVTQECERFLGTLG